MKLFRAVRDVLRQVLAKLPAYREAELRELDGNVAEEISGVELFEQVNVKVENFVRRRFSRDVFPQMVQANGAPLRANGGAGGEDFIKRFTGDESASEAVFHAAARDHVGHAGLGRKPKNEIAGEQRFVLGCLCLEMTPENTGRSRCGQMRPAGMPAYVSEQEPFSSLKRAQL